MPAPGEALRTWRHDFLRSLASRAAGAKEAPALVRRWVEKREDRLFAALGGAMSFQILRTASKVGLFALLDERPGLRAEEIAASLGLGIHPTRILLLGLVPMELVDRIGDRYYADPLLSGILSGRIDGGGLGKILEYFQEVVNPAVLHLEASVREGRPVGLHRLFGPDAGSFYEALGHDEARGACFREAMLADTRWNRDAVAASEAFAGQRRLLDVGGNTGELAIAIAAHHPGIHVTVLDFPETAAIAAERFRALGLEGRLDALGQDLLGHDLPCGYDGVLFAHFLDIFSPDKIRGFLARAFACLPEGGSVTVFGSVMRDDERGPRTYGVLSAYFLCLAGGEGRFYTAEQTAEAMREAGFADIERTALPRSEVLLRGTKSRARARRTVGGRIAATPARRAEIASFVRLGRPQFLVYSLLFYGLGSAALVADGRRIDPGRWIHGLAFVACAHLMTHYCNEYFDLAADAQNRAPTRWTGGSRVLVDGRLPPGVSLGAAFVLLFASLALALALPGAGPRGIALLVLALAWFYTAPPLALNYRGLGEIAVALVLCAGVPLLAYDVQRGQLALPSVLLGAVVPLVVAQTARMLVMNLCDVRSDRIAGKRTLAVALGPWRARRAFATAQLAVVGSILVSTAAGVLPVTAGAAMVLVSPLSAWLSLQLLSGAPRSREEADHLAFWASTHVAILGAAAAFGLLASGRGSFSASSAFTAVILAVPLSLLVLQIQRRLAEEVR